MADGGDLELQAAMNAHLAADAAVQALFGNPPRIYQDVPTVPVFPYATLGETTENDDSSSCGAGSLVFADVHVWSRAPGFEEVKRIASTIRQSLHGADLTLGSERCVFIDHAVTRHLRDAEIPAKHAILTFRAALLELP